MAGGIGVGITAPDTNTGDYGNSVTGLGKLVTDAGLDPTQFMQPLVTDTASLSIVEEADKGKHNDNKDPILLSALAAVEADTNRIKAGLEQTGNPNADKVTKDFTDFMNTTVKEDRIRKSEVSDMKGEVDTEAGQLAQPPSTTQGKVLSVVTGQDPSQDLSGNEQNLPPGPPPYSQQDPSQGLLPSYSGQDPSQGPLPGDQGP